MNLSILDDNYADNINMQVVMAENKALKEEIQSLQEKLNLWDEYYSTWSKLVDKIFEKVLPGDYIVDPIGGRDCQTELLKRILEAVPDNKTKRAKNWFKNLFRKG